VPAFLRVVQTVVLCLLVGACSQSGERSDETTTAPTSTSAQAPTTVFESREDPEDDSTVVVVFLEDSMMNGSGTDLSPTGQTLRGELADIDGVLEVWLVDKHEALDEARELLADDPDMLAVLESDPALLPASIRVRVVDRTAQMTVVERASDRPGVKNVGTLPPP
jgi:hypothetical protein